MWTWAGSVLRRRATAALVVVAVASAVTGAAVAAGSGAVVGDGVHALAAPPRVSLATLQTRGLTVRVTVSSDERVLRLHLIRRAGKRVSIMRTFHLHGHAGVLLRWRLSAATAARLRTGRYALQATSGDSLRTIDGIVRRTGVRLVGPRTPPPAPSAPSAPAATPTAHPTSANPCGAVQPPAWQHVVWVVMENTGYDGIVGARGAPYLNGLAARCGLATNFYAETHPSLPNYIAMTSGDPQGIKDDNAPSAHPLAVPSIFSQLGSDWRSLQESMPSACPRKTSGKYAVKHDPAAYYTNIPCATQDVPLADPPDLSARFTFVTPNLCNDMHDCPVSTGDTWLSQWLPKLMDTPQYQSGTTAIFVTWDEDDHSQGNHVATLVIAPSVPAGTQVATRFDHYSMLRTTEEMLGLPTTLGAAATAVSMRAGFHL
jgi:hypothetical protein